MKIEQCILQDEKIAPQMQAFLEEIEMIEKIDAFLKSRPKNRPTNLRLVGAFERKIRSAKKRFELINEAYSGSPEKSAMMPEGWLNEIKEGVEEIDDLFMRLHFQ
ncbi:MAG TPA: hypothetical protein VK213_13515 [Bacteroidales bacterium]|nr:hypothetical protein [Bacteroidales bacterium]